MSKGLEQVNTVLPLFRAAFITHGAITPVERKVGGCARGVFHGSDEALFKHALKCPRKGARCCLSECFADQLQTHVYFLLFS